MDIRKFFVTKKIAERQEEASTSTSTTVSVFDDESEFKSDSKISLSIAPTHVSSPTNDMCESDITDVGTLDGDPVQPKLQIYPYTKFGFKKRSFQYNWVEKFNWLEYSVRNNVALCFACRNFKKHTLVNRAEKQGYKLATTGFSNWKRALDVFKEHEQSGLHKEAMTKWAAYKNSKIHGNIVEQLHVFKESEILERREYLTRLVSVTKFLGKQGLAFRGHDEGESSNEKGNFLQLVDLIKKFDPFLQNYKIPGNASYLSPTSQNEIKHQELVQLSETRWACQINAIKSIFDNYSAILLCLSNITSATALGLGLKLRKLSTVYCLIMFKCLLSVTEGFHILLQKENIDLTQAIEFKEAVCDTLNSYRNDQKSNEIFEQCVEFCNTNEIDIEDTQKRTIKMRRMDEFVIEASSGQRERMNTADIYKTNIYYPCLDRMTSELNQRFSTVNSALLKGMQACNPLSQNFLKYEDLITFSKFYQINLNASEVDVARNYLSHKLSLDVDKEKSVINVYKLLDPVMFPTLKTIFQIVLTVPVSSCSCERSFSVLRRLHTWLRGTMTQNRLNDLALMSIEKNVLDGITDESVIDRFSNQSKRRYSLVLKQN